MQIVDIFEQIAENGHAPREGCRLFNVGYEDAFQRLRKVYLEGRFNHGRSAEKFVVGQYGSGKTHFLRTLAEKAREMNCATAEVAFNKDIDPSQSLVVYQEVAREIRSPRAAKRGIRGLLESALDEIGAKALVTGAEPEDLQRAWIEALEASDLSLAPYAKVLRLTLEGLMRGQDSVVDAGSQWLGGSMGERTLASKLGVPHYPKAEHNLVGRRALLSLLQFIRKAGFRGTLVGFDEADQGLSMIEGRKLQRILSMFMAGINALQDLEDGSALVIYAVTPGIIEKMMEFPALQQRVIDPAPDQGFFDGNTFAPQIRLSLQADSRAELREIAHMLVQLFVKNVASVSAEELNEVMEKADVIADAVAREDATGSARRSVARQTCTMLLKHSGRATVDSVSLNEAEV